MNQTRYKILTEYVPSEWIQGSPIEILKGTILLDQFEDTTALQLKLCNNSKKTINSVHIQIGCYDETGEAIRGDNIVYFAYQDLHIPPGTFFGDQQLVILPDRSVRKVVVIFVKTMFVDGVVFPFKGLQTRKLPVLKALPELGSDLFRELERILPENNPFARTFIPEMYSDDTWACTCGKINEIGDLQCVRCGRQRLKQLEVMNASYLQKSLNILKEQARKQEEMDALNRMKSDIERMKESKKERRIVIWIMSFTVLICAGLYEWYQIAEPRLHYTKALRQFEAGQFLEAKEAFLKLGDYKDAADRVNQAEDRMKQAAAQMKQTEYEQAIEARSNGYYVSSINAFASLGEYKDSKEQWKESVFQFAIHLLHDKKYTEALAQLEMIPSYRDHDEGRLEILYQNAVASLKAGNPVSAMTVLKGIVNYKNSKTLILECQYRIALNHHRDRKEIAEARQMFKQLGKYKDSAKQYEIAGKALLWQGKWYKLKYQEWFQERSGKRLVFNRTYGPFGKEPFNEYMEIDFYSQKLKPYSSDSNLTEEFVISGKKLISDFHGSKETYTLSGNKLILKSNHYIETYVREDKMNEVKP
ncbi:hypothetical protein [Cohnella silvisoli]|uniref:Tetratricopeptide repeat protein n=1 Tax=Cohnella silvisoli TaxID=2873699 RepID=A0ABV1KRZ9_9BACL|nr:hypothetical protein [Cohnella silvisoli]MCD9022582.1 hypothetical protein [Cohnella silvisoli]